MTPDDILRLRLDNQRIARSTLRTAEDVVAWFGAMQAQDYLGSLWAIGQRMKTATEATVEASEARRAIVRTWPMRGTLHFVAAGDARWMTRLLAPRVIARNAARMKREFNVDARVVGRSHEILGRAMEGGRRLDRSAIYEALEARRIRTGNSRGLHILLWLAMEGVLCLAGRHGKQHTFAMLDDWLPDPDPNPLERDEALSKLARRYFMSHGPATMRDFVWWAGITVKDARAAIDGARSSLMDEVVDGATYWWHEPQSNPPRGTKDPKHAPQVSLLPTLDEYTVGYHDRSLLLGNLKGRSKMELLNPAVLLDGRVVGTWKRAIDKQSVSIDTRLWRALSRAEHAALEEAGNRYAAFLGLGARLRAVNSRHGQRSAARGSPASS
jgi:hypothetical protein